MAEGEENRYLDSFDIWYFIAGGLAALVALYLVKNILEPSSGTHHHWHTGHQHHPRAVPISKEVEKVYRIDDDGKMY